MLGANAVEDVAECRLPVSQGTPALSSTIEHVLEIGSSSMRGGEGRRCAGTFPYSTALHPLELLQPLRQVKLAAVDGTAQIPHGTPWPHPHQFGSVLATSHVATWFSNRSLPLVGQAALALHL
jgi:hypothetical protein